MRLFTACLGTETHTWAPLPTDERAFGDGYLIRNGEHPHTANMFGVPLTLWRDRARERGHEVVEGLCAFATPSGPTTRRTYEAFRDEILADLQRALPVDAVLLSLHGAMVAEGYDDCEADLVHRIRWLTGPDVFIGCELDLHCHISRQFVGDVTAFVTYKEYPHVDFAERAEELWQLMERTLSGAIAPKISVHDCRMIGIFHTTSEPMRGYVAQMREMEGRDGVVSISLAHGFPWANVPHVGARVVVITDDAQAYGDAIAAELGERLWALRESALPACVDVEEAIDAALAVSGAPVVLADVADNPGGGAAGDSTFIARALLARGVSQAAIGGIWDPVAVDICRGAGLGATLGLRLGGKAGPWSGQPLDLEVTVTGVFRDMLVEGLGGSMRRIGDTVTLQANGLEFVVHAARCQNFHPSFFENAGIDWSKKKILVVKSMHHFHACYAAYARAVVYVSTPGVVNPDLRRLPLVRAARPLWPLDADPWSNGARRAW